MRFYQYWNGFVWEFNSLSEYFLAVLGRLIGAVIGVIILFGFAEVTHAWKNANIFGFSLA